LIGSTPVGIIYYLSQYWGRQIKP